MRLESGYCYTVAATGGPGVEDLDLRLLDGDGHLLAHDEGADSHPVVPGVPDHLRGRTKSSCG